MFKMAKNWSGTWSPLELLHASFSSFPSASRPRAWKEVSLAALPSRLLRHHKPVGVRALWVVSQLRSQGLGEGTEGMRTNRLLNPGRPTCTDACSEGFLRTLSHTASISLSSGLGGHSGGSNNIDRSYRLSSTVLSPKPALFN